MSTIINQGNETENNASHKAVAKIKGLPDRVVYEILSKSANDYASIIDEFDTNKGLNNYADGALSICSVHRNESQQWRSSLTVESIMEMDEVKRMISQTMETFKQLTTVNDDVILPSGVNITPYPDPAYTTGGSSSHTNLPEPSGNLVSSRDVLSHVSLPPGSIRHTTTHNTHPQSDHIRIISDHHTKLRDSWNPKGPRSSGLSGSQSGVASKSRSRTFDQGDSTNEVYRQAVKRKTLFESEVESPVESNQNATDMYSTRQPKISNSRSWTDHHDTGQENSSSGPFKTARDQLIINNQQKNNKPPSVSTYGTNRRSLGARRGPSSRFVPPITNKDDSNSCELLNKIGPNRGHIPQGSDTGEVRDERLRGIDPKMVELIMNEVMDSGPQIGWGDIAGLEFAKKSIKEIVVWPMLRPDIFTGLRGPPKGLLLFGPPGTGKTLIGKCVASQSKSTFFSISASSLTSKWVGEGEKMVRALFTVARCRQPAVIFIDEIDSLLTQRGDGEHESTRRIKTEFLVQLDGATTVSDERLLVIGATNRPQEIDEAARRRFVKRLYIPLPDPAARTQLVMNLLSQQHCTLSETELGELSHVTEGYSGSDMANLCREAALGPIRCIDDIENISPDQVRPINYSDFTAALTQVRASVSSAELGQYVQWNTQYGSGGK